MKKIRLKLKTANIETLFDFIDEELSNKKGAKDNLEKTKLLCEEIFNALILKGNKDSYADIFIKANKIFIRAKGEKLDLDATREVKLVFSDDFIDENVEDTIRQMLINANKDFFSLSYKNNVNVVKIVAGKPTQNDMLKVLCALGLGVVFGIILRFFPEPALNIISNYVFSPIKTLFLNALKMVVAPMVFFSIAASVGSFTDFSQLGKIGARVMLFYTCTTVMAIGISLGMFFLLSPGDFGIYAIEGSNLINETQNVNFITVLTSIIPSNFFAAFVNGDMLQIIFLAILFGFATSILGEHRERVSNFLNAGNDLFLKVASLITKCLPLMVFASIATLFSSTNMSEIKKLFEVLLDILLSNVLLIICYLIIIFVFGKKNPIDFIKKAQTAWVNAFALCSSNAAMSYTMEVCDKKLRIKPQIYSFSIPLGATINMDGLCVLLTSTTMFFAKCYGITITGVSIASLIFTIVILSMGTPGMPGAAVMCASVLFQQFGIPLEAISLFVALATLLDPIDTANNVMGDIVGTYSIAAKTGLLKEN